MRREAAPSAWVRATPSAAALILLALAMGCSDDMRDQPYSRPMDASKFFLDGTSMRPRAPGTVAVDEGGPVESELAEYERLEVTPALLALGRDRFESICAVCHAQDGYGEGVVVQRGFPAPPSLHEPRLREAEDAHLLTVARNGLGKMPPYGSVLSRRERFAVVRYIRALQLSQHAPIDALPADVRERLAAKEGGTP